MMLLGSVRARLTVRQAQLIIADPDNFLDPGPDASQSADLRGIQCQAIGGVVLLVVSDNRLFHRFQFSGRTTTGFDARRMPMQGTQGEVR